MSEALAGYAVDEQSSKGRNFREKEHPYRNVFERDRDRIIHSQAFRRLEGKTQVFAPAAGDSYRNRLTHSIEVSQIGRTIAKRLEVNESLTEAVCLAHDLGHPPFGHIGEKFLNQLMQEFGGFEHNQQTLRVVDLLEHPYPDFIGLNLTYETRLSLARHKSPYDRPEEMGFEETNCPIEGQIANMADRIAYNCHDLEDGLRAQLITTGQLKDIELFELAREHIGAGRIQDSSVQKTRTAKSMIDILVSDCIYTSAAAIAELQPKTCRDVYNAGRDLICLSKENEARLREIELFLLEKLYQHESFTQTQEKINQHLKQLFERLLQQPKLMPSYYQCLIDSEGLERVVCDYISGMTDRFCLKILDEL
ncbi:MAG: deoxyguanosinetriphosphate triphosphohydrolase [Planctomycetota bacterium]|jgi:dGTPase